MYDIYLHAYADQINNVYNSRKRKLIIVTGRSIKKLRIIGS